MATLTTLENGTRGFQLYMDGRLAGEMVGDINYYSELLMYLSGLAGSVAMHYSPMLNMLSRSEVPCLFSE